MNDYTLMIWSGDRAPVRRMHVRGRWLARIAWAVAGLVILSGAFAWDYTGKWEAHSQLQATTSRYQKAVAQQKRVTLALSRLEGEIARVAELEHKLRVIADLPTDPTIQPDSSLTDTPVGGSVVPGGLHSRQPGGVPASDSPEAGNPLPEYDSYQGDQFSRIVAEPTGAHSLSLMSRLEQFAGRVAWRTDSLTRLISGLETRQRRLASMPAIWPARGWLTSAFGPRRSPFTGRVQHHDGIDIAAPFGTPVVAPGDGEVTFVGQRGPMGNALVINHGGGVETLYGHTKEIHVRSGQRVERGDLIAQIGDSGRSTGPHLHYVVEVAGVPRDPMGYILE